MDTRNSSVTFWNIYITPYNHLIEDTIINNLKKTINKEISILFNNLEIKKPYQQE